jgi:hypothetical protein
MGVKLHCKTDEQLISVYDLKDGQIAEIIIWPFNYKGRIVQRVGDDLITIGGGYGRIFISFYTSTKMTEPAQVRVLNEGETLVITSNIGE